MTPELLDAPSPVSTFEDATPLLDQPQLLREKASEDGFLYFRHFLPADLILELREQVLQILNLNGWLDPRAPLSEGRIDPQACRELGSFCGAGVPKAAYAEIQKLELFHALPHYPKLIQLYATLLGKQVFVHPRHIMRALIPSEGYRATPPHQDFIHIQGTSNVWTCWMPLGDCPPSLGGLSVLRGSHKQGVYHVTRAEGAGDLETILCQHDFTWVTGGYETGDLVTFISTTVHKGLPTQDKDHVRLSCDFRYQPASEEIERQSLVPHCGFLKWDEIYAGWKRDAYKYYWLKEDLKMSPWDEGVRWQKERIC